MVDAAFIRSRTCGSIPGRWLRIEVGPSCRRERSQAPEGRQGWGQSA